MAARGGAKAAKPRPTAKSGKKKAGALRPGRSASATAADIDDALVERTVSMLLAHDRATAASKREIGAHVLDSYFEGSEALVRSRDRTKSKSFARLAERAVEDTLWDERDLREAVTIELTARTLPQQVADAIDPTYLLMLGSVEDLEKRVELATRISRDELRGDAAKAAIRRAAGERLGGRRTQPAPVRGANELDRDGERMERDGLFDPAELEGLAGDQLRSVHESLLRHQGRIAAFVRATGQALKDSPAAKKAAPDK